MRAVDLTFFDTAKHKAVTSVEVGAPIEDVYRAFALEPETWHEWFPSFKPGGRYDSTPIAPGATRYMTMGRNDLEEVMLAVEEPTRWAWYVAKGSMPVKAFAENYAFKDLGNGATQLTWTVAFDANPIVGLGIKVATGRMIKKAAANLTARLNGQKAS